MKKKLLLISFIPYILFLLKCLYDSIFGICYHFDKCYYGVDGFLESFIGGLEEIIFSYYVVFLLLIVGYQIYYFICVHKTRLEGNSNGGKTIFSKKRLNIKKILFIISICCWILYLSYGLYSFMFGYRECFFHCTHLYGFDAFLSSMFWVGLAFCIIPILPITLIYIIIYVFNLIGKNKSI